MVRLSSDEDYLDLRSYSDESIFRTRYRQATHWMIKPKFFFSFPSKSLERRLVQEWDWHKVPLLLLTPPTYTARNPFGALLVLAKEPPRIFFALKRLLTNAIFLYGWSWLILVKKYGYKWDSISGLLVVNSSVFIDLSSMSTLKLQTCLKIKQRCLPVWDIQGQSYLHMVLFLTFKAEVLKSVLT